MIKQFKIFNRPIARPNGAALIAGAMVFYISVFNFTPQATAQTDFNIAANSEDLKSEFQSELDKWMLRAYEGDRDAQFKVGVLFANDQFGPPENEQAAYWYTQAARQGHVLAQYNLGHHYLTGSGVKRDEKTAMQWWLKAAQQQHALAQFNVGRAYYLGIGLKKDLPQARLWFERASQNKEPKSTELLKQLGWWDPSAVASVDQPNLDTPALETPEPTQVTELSESRKVGIEVTRGSQDSQPLRSKIDPIDQIEPKPASKVSAIMPPVETVSEPSAVTNEPLTSKEEQGDTEQAISTANAVDNSANGEVKNEATNSEVVSTQKKSIAVFTNPAIRSVLISILDDTDLLTVINEGGEWTTVNAENGFPVWINKNFIKVNGSSGTVTAQSVNARSVPLITTGSIVGRLDQGERVTVMNRRNDWFRIRSPQRFKGWVKTEDYELAKRINDSANELAARQAAPSPEPKPQAAPATKPKQGSEVATVTSSSDESVETINLAPSPTYKSVSDDEQAKETETETETATKAEPHAEGLKGLPPTINDNAWLFAQREDHHALQLASFNDIESIKRYVNSLSFKRSKNLRLFTTESSDGVEWTYVIYGAYNTKEAAKAKASELKQRKAWIRRLGILQQNRCVAWKRQLPAPQELNRFCK